MVVTPNGAQIKIYNDPANLVEKKILPEQSYTYTYDNEYNLTRTTNADSDLSFTYDPLSRLTLAQTAGTSISYAYDISSNLTSMTDPAGVIANYIYDNLNRLTDIQSQGQGISHYNYDALSRRTGKTISGTSLNTSYSYDLASRLLSITNLPTTINDTYTYDNVGNRLSLADNTGFHNYVYDNVYRLSSASNPNENYSYDPVGNRNPLTQTYDSGNRLLDDGTYTYTYDHDGNMTKKVKKVGGDTTTYSYNSEDQLIGIVTPTQTISYKYDAIGRRIEKNVAGTRSRYVYNGEDIIQELDGNNNIVAKYVHGPGIDEPICLEKNNQKYYYIADGLGSITAIVDQNGNIAQSYRYDSFGNIISQTGSLTQPYTYTGREFDSETGLFYYRHRYYDSKIGRFLQQDPIGFAGGINKYIYTLNNPIKYIDPFGLDVWVENTTAVNGLHRRIAVTTAKGQYSQSFGMMSGELPQQGFWHAMGVQPSPQAEGSGIVYEDTLDAATKEVIRFETTGAEDKLIEEMLKSELDNTGPYNAFSNSCRNYSMREFYKIRKIILGLRKKANIRNCK
jgi:RHS repeat-associated protein